MIDFIGRATVTGILFAVAMIALMSSIPFGFVMLAGSAFLVSLFLTINS